MKMKTGMNSHKISGISSYQAKGCASQIAICTARIIVASFQRLNRTKPLINAAKVGARKVSIPIELAGLTYGTSHPKMNPAKVPNKGPNRGAVKPECIILEKVIIALVPRTG